MHNLRLIRFFLISNSQMFLRATRRLSPLLEISSVQEYQALKATSDAPVLIGWFSAKHSLPAKIFAPDFVSLAQKYPAYQFFTLDVDQAPGAAYDAEVTDAPEVVVMPVGLKPDGTHFDKTDWVGIRSELGRYDQLVPRAREVIDRLAVGEERRSEKPAWVFDPATGTSLPIHQSY